MRRADRATEWRVDHLDGGVQLSGRLRTPQAAEITDSIRRATKGAREIDVDLARVEDIDPGVVALIGADLRTRNVDFHVHGSPRFGALFELCTEGVPLAPRTRQAEGLLAQVGRKAALFAADVRGLLDFTGELTVATLRVVRRPGTGHWKDLPLLVDRAGLDAIPILMVLNFLVGFVLAFTAARTLSVFGANIYVADLVALGMTRQLGPIMTGFLVAGRSGAAYATEIGSMRIAQEIDALRTLGLPPFEWLVLPRILTLLMVVPVLTVLANLVGILGGLLVAVVSLRVSPYTYLVETKSVLDPWDVGFGLVMSMAFAIAIGLIACERGLSASGGPLGVGRRTTSTVVRSLFAMVLIDAILTVVFRAIGLT